MPVISVVVPTRNRAASLTRAVRSVLAQTFGDFELIVVDDASEDDTAAGIDEWRARDTRLRSIRHPERRGGGAARNSGLELARAPWVAFLDDDDEWSPTKLEHQLGLARKAGAGTLVYAPVLAVGDAGPPMLLGGQLDRDRPCESLCEGNRIPTPGVLVDRAALTEVGGFDADMPRLQDWDLWLRLCGRVRFVYDDALLARTFQSGVRISTDSQALERAAERLAAKYPDNVRLRLTLAHMLVAEGAPAPGVRMFGELARDGTLNPLLHLRLAFARLAPGAYRALARVSARRQRKPIPANPWQDEPDG